MSLKYPCFGEYLVSQIENCSQLVSPTLLGIPACFFSFHIFIFTVRTREAPYNSTQLTSLLSSLDSSKLIKIENVNDSVSSQGFLLLT